MHVQDKCENVECECACMCICACVCVRAGDSMLTFSTVDLSVLPRENLLRIATGVVILGRTFLVRLCTLVLVRDVSGS